MMTPRIRARSMMPAIASAAIWIAAGASLLACPVCFQVEHGPVTTGVMAAVIVLVGVTSVVLTTAGVFLFRLLRRNGGPT